ncbi:transmembrane protein 69-like [Acanthochromis polyacanthus]|uniref:Transmembrane protein 69 n=1 Tax=Acanthochromis polyacanthus TaxID=80966 RepID=A0A3Q1FCF9_9TELE|nr:transmembrane protein 69-like [Acanthochromis polyacanthus]
MSKSYRITLRFKMIRFASGRRLMSGVPLWGCLQQIHRAPNYCTKAQLLFHPQASCMFMASRPASTANRLWSIIRPVSWHASRLCHGDSRGTSESHDSKEGFSLRALTKAPKPALYLGFSGLIPFLSAPLLMAATQSFYPEVAYAQMVYGASIVSFLGGARWGFAIPEGSPAQPDWMNLGNSVVPSLVAWLALLCRDNIAEGALVVIMGLGLSLHYDLTLLPGYPAWFKAMRTILTLVATFSLVATLALKEFCPEKKIKEIQK